MSSNELSPEEEPLTNDASVLPVALFADGGCLFDNPSPYGGTWAFCMVDADGKRVRHAGGMLTPEKIRLPYATNNVMELFALVRGILNLPAEFSGGIYSDSDNALGRVFRGWKLKGVPDWLAEATGKARAHLKVLCAYEYVLLSGHPTKNELAAGVSAEGRPVSIHNDWCHRFCDKLAQKFADENPAIVAAEKAKRAEKKEAREAAHVL